MTRREKLIKARELLEQARLYVGDAGGNFAPPSLWEQLGSDCGAWGDIDRAVRRVDGALRALPTHERFAGDSL